MGAVPWNLTLLKGAVRLVSTSGLSENISRSQVVRGSDGASAKGWPPAVGTVKITRVAHGGVLARPDPAERSLNYSRASG